MSAVRNPLHTHCQWLVGMGFFTSDAHFDPSRQWPGTQWQKIEGQFILAASESHVVGEVGGEEKHTLTEDELPVIDGEFATAVVANHTVLGVSGHAYGAEFTDVVPENLRISWETKSSPAQYGYGYKFGGNKPHNNMPPYVTRIYWERVG